MVKRIDLASAKSMSRLCSMRPAFRQKSLHHEIPASSRRAVPRINTALPTAVATQAIRHRFRSR